MAILNLNYYVPSDQCYLRYGSKTIEILGIRSFTIDIDHLEANYSVWVDTVSIQPLLPTDIVGCDVIQMGAIDANHLNAIFVIDGEENQCTLKAISYHLFKHAYLVSLRFNLDKKCLKKYKYDEKAAKKTNRFEIMDLE